MTNRIDLETALRIARTLMDATGIGAAEAAQNPAIPADLRDELLVRLEAERVIHIRDPHMVEDRSRVHEEWLHLVDRSGWYYWRRLREHLLDRRGWSEPVVRSIDRATDRILGAMENPRGPDFRTRGLIVGHVQSGKTANYSGLIAKAADCGYRLVIVLTGIHNSLRQQTQRRLTSELVGSDGGRIVGVGPPSAERIWHTFTGSEVYADFDPGNAAPTALVGTNPVLIVAKKWVTVLQDLIDWFDSAPDGVLDATPTLIIDDEADLASINTGGDRPPDAEGVEGADPSRTNALIRQLLIQFRRVAYVAYTATPFANVLIDPNAIDRIAGEDLYPRDFIIDLPEPPGYFGAEHIFGLPYDGAEGTDPSLDVIRRVPDDDVPRLVPARRSEVEDFEPQLPESLRHALDDFILAGAARIHRGDVDQPATMLIHTSYRTAIQHRLTQLVQTELERLQEEWRYFRGRGMEERLRLRWDDDFRPVIRSVNHDLDAAYENLIEPISVFLNQLQVRQINSGSLDELDYERDPDLKVIVVGGNRLSRGLTLEGLLVSYYVRPAKNYDTLMQMGRWFGFREGYADLTRIYTTEQLENWFRDLALVELEVRRDIERYEREGLTPLDFGVHIRKHPAMLVTSPLKMQHILMVDVSYNRKLVQTINFPFDDRSWLRRNVDITRGLLSSLGRPLLWKPGQPMWERLPWNTVVDFLTTYQMEYGRDVDATSLVSYIRRQAALDELVEWLVAVMGQSHREPRLGPSLDIGIHGGLTINPIERTRIRNRSGLTYTLKAITSTQDQEVGLTPDQIRQAQAEGASLGENLREVRDPRQGLLLIYPISKHSGHGRTDLGADQRETASGTLRVPIFENPDLGEDVIGIALAFPRSQSAAAVEFVTGRVATTPE